MIRRISLVLIGFLLNVLPLVGSAQPVTLPPSPALRSENGLQDLQRDLSDIFNDPNFSNATWGVCVQSLETGQYLFRLNDTKSLLPASNFKLLTAAEALTVLTPDFHFTTQLLSAGRISEYTLKGDLVIRGAGDPTLGAFSMLRDTSPMRVFEAWADSLERLGIRKIEGSIIGDDSYFTDDLYPAGWALEDEPYYYAMQTSALSFAENQVSVSVTPGTSVGSKARFELIPSTSYLTVVNHATTKADSIRKRLTGGGDTLIAAGTNTIEITRALGSPTIIIKGEIPLSGAEAHEQLSVVNPARYAATIFREVLEARGIQIIGPTMTISELKKPFPYLKARVLAQYISPPLPDIISVMNKQSDNMFAEQLFRTVAKEQEGEGSWTKGIEAMKKYLASIGIAPDRVAIYDGSGLSRMDLISPVQLVTVLRAMYDRPTLFKLFYPSLSIVGVDGTLARRLKDTRAQGNVHAKTGFVTGVRSISGYLTTHENELLAFSIIGNNFTTPVSLANNLQDLVLLRLVNFSRK
ncbi:MAG: D-alanyl-D-alanine carboxypeptidase/D-alanyl-D-alanine-endopeptidase [Candidatus Kapaibacterium sp.]